MEARGPGYPDPPPLNPALGTPLPQPITVRDFLLVDYPPKVPRVSSKSSIFVITSSWRSLFDSPPTILSPVVLVRLSVDCSSVRFRPKFFVGLTREVSLRRLRAEWLSPDTRFVRSITLAICSGHVCVRYPRLDDRISPSKAARRKAYSPIKSEIHPITKGKLEGFVRKRSAVSRHGQGRR